MSDEFTEAQRAVMGKIKKLLDLAAKNTNANESAAALAKAQTLLAQHNLSSDVVQAEGSVDSKREQAKVDGGTYAYQRELWEAVAELNFCLYWSQRYRTDEKVRQNVYERDFLTGENKYVGKKWVQVRRRRHALIGRMVNTRSTVAMAQYLEAAVERLLTERLAEGDVQRHSNWAWSFRKGVAAAIIGKLYDRRRRNMDEERRKKMEMEKTAASGSSDSRGLTIASFSKSEKDANIDFRYGEGTSAAWAAARAERARISAAAEQAYTAWAAANPGEALSKFKYVDEKTGETVQYHRPRGGGGYGSSQRDNIDGGAYNAGLKAGKSVGIDPQTDDRKAGLKRIGR